MGKGGESGFEATGSLVNFGLSRERFRKAHRKKKQL